MRKSDLAMLCCLECGGDLHIKTAQFDSEENIAFGLISCVSCGRTYPILDHVLLAFKKDVLASYLSVQEVDRLQALGLQEAFVGAQAAGTQESAQVAVAENWEYQWNEVMAYDSTRLQGDGLYSAQAMQAFIPIPKENIQNKTVFIGCGGRGREAFHMCALGAGRVLVNELGREIYGILQATGLPPSKVLLIRGDIRCLPIKDGGVDIALCDHALQHVLDHRRGFASLARIVRAGGLVAVCVYSHENNFIMTHMVEPAKALLHKIPLKALRYISLIPSTLCFAIIHTIYVPLDKIAVAGKLPIADHMLFWSRFRFADLWGSIFDLLHAPISYHFRKSELEEMSRDNKLDVRVLINTHKTLWSLVAQRP